MSSLVRRIQRDPTRSKKNPLGSKLGVKNLQAKDLLARLEREKKHGSSNRNSNPNGGVLCGTDVRKTQDSVVAKKHTLYIESSS